MRAADDVNTLLVHACWRVIASVVASNVVGWVAVAGWSIRRMLRDVARRDRDGTEGVKKGIIRGFRGGGLARAGAVIGPAEIRRILSIVAMVSPDVLVGVGTREPRSVRNDLR